MSVVEKNTGEVILEKKFRKTEFNELLNDRQYSIYLDGLIEKAMVKLLNSDEGIDINPESYEEIKALADELDVDL